MTAAAQSSSPVKQSRFMRRALPYLLSLPALIMCIGILIPFFTAVYYSLLRYRMNLPAMKGFIWFQNYINFFTDPKFWNTVYISLTYAALTVGLELLIGLGIVRAESLAHFRAHFKSIRADAGAKPGHQLA